MIDSDVAEAIIKENIRREKLTPVVLSLMPGDSVEELVEAASKLWLSGHEVIIATPVALRRILEGMDLKSHHVESEEKPDA